MTEAPDSYPALRPPTKHDQSGKHDLPTTPEELLIDCGIAQRVFNAVKNVYRAIPKSEDGLVLTEPDPEKAIVLTEEQKTELYGKPEDRPEEEPMILCNIEECNFSVITEDRTGEREIQIVIELPNPRFNKDAKVDEVNKPKFRYTFPVRGTMLHGDLDHGPLNVDQKLVVKLLADRVAL